jgi:hypothetical protein
MRQDFAYLYDAQLVESVQRDGKGLLNPVNDSVFREDVADHSTRSRAFVKI